MSTIDNTNNIDNTNEGVWSVQRSRKMIQQMKQDQRNVSRENSVSDINSRSGSPQIASEIIRPIPTRTPQPSDESSRPTSTTNCPMTNSASSSPVNVPVSQTPMMTVPYLNGNVVVPQNHNAGNPQNMYFLPTNDLWSMWHDIFAQQHIMFGKFLEKIKEELKYPPVLRGKSDDIRKNEICEKLFPIIDSILKETKDERFKKNQWHESMTPTKVTGMINEAHTPMELLSYFEAPTFPTLRTMIDEACEVLVDFKTKKEVKETIKEEVNPVKKEEVSPVKKEEVKPVKKEENKTVKKEEVKVVKTVEKKDAISEQTDETDSIESDSSDDDSSVEDEPSREKNKSKTQYNKFTVDQVLEYKKALVEAQEKFFDSCMPTKSEINEVKDNIQYIKNWSGVAKRVSTVKDEILVGTHKFSKSHYLNNTYFQKRLIKKYQTYFPNVTGVKLVLPKKETNQFSIVLYV